MNIAVYIKHMNKIESALDEVKTRLYTANFVSGPCYFAADACRELGLCYTRQIKYVQKDEIHYFPKRDTQNLRPRHRVMITERGLRAFVEIAARKGKI